MQTKYIKTLLISYSGLQFNYLIIDWNYYQIREPIDSRLRI